MFHLSGFRSALALAAIAGCLCTPAQAGLLKLKVDKGSTGNITIYDYQSGPMLWQLRNVYESVDTDADGEIEFSLGIEKADMKITIMKTVDGKKLDPYDIEVKKGSVTLASLEPFDIPNFVMTGLGSVATDMDAVAFVADLTHNYLLGSEFEVLSGRIANSESFFFHDANGLGLDGTVRVSGFDLLRSPLSEPGSAALVGLSLFAGLACRRSH